MSDEIDMRDASSVDEDDLNDEALEVISEFAVIVSLRLKTRIRRNFGNYANADFSSLFRSLDAVSASVPVAGPGQLPASGGQAGRDLYRGEYRGPCEILTSADCRHSTPQFFQSEVTIPS